MHLIRFSIFIASFIVYLPPSLLGQEICDNAIDDDGDGLIDLNDDDCICLTTVDFSLTPNPSLDDILCCPDNFSQMHCVEAWVQGSDATTDYYNSCGFTSYLDSETVDASFTKTTPFPPESGFDNKGFVGFYSGSSISGGNYKEYLSVCLNQPLYKDSSYIFEFLLGFGRQTEKTVSSKSPFEIFIFGISDCTKVSFTGTSCPLEANEGWEKIGSHTETGEEEWKLVRMEITPSFTIEAIAIGSNCENISKDSIGYYFLDEFILAKNNNPFAFTKVQVKSGLPCMKNLILTTNNFDNASFQWYYNKKAIIGANQIDYKVLPDEIGIYQVMIQLEDQYILAKEYEYKIEGFPKANLGRDTFICLDSILVLGANNEGSNFLWNTQDSSKLLSINKPGLYSILVSNDCGVSYDEINVTSFNPELDCDIKIPNAFTPNNDGVNDEFRIITECCFSSFDLKIFNRWGEIIFASTEVNLGWSGLYANIDAPPDVYIWTLEYSFLINGTKLKNTKAGDITLIR